MVSSGGSPETALDVGWALGLSDGATDGGVAEAATVGVAAALGEAWFSPHAVTRAATRSTTIEVRRIGAEC
jgi:hypothetical protein